MPESIAALMPGALRRPVKRAFRSVGVATSAFRPLPDYLIIGTHRAGTTSLHECLLEHPCVAPGFPAVQQIKGVRFFDEHYHEGADWYRSHFPTRAYRQWILQRYGRPALAGDASPYYLFHPLAAERAARLVPHARLIVLVRNPIDRAYSHWRRERRDGTEPLATFEQALAAEPDRLAGETLRILSNDRYYSYAHENFSYLTQGLYMKALDAWLRHFRREQIHVEVSERFSAEPQRVYDRVLQFLGLPPHRLRHGAQANVNPATRELDAHTRRQLAARVAAENRRLEQCLGVPLGWDTR